jgi:ribosome-binding protein aMBF1 (putative translation factor)
MFLPRKIQHAFVQITEKGKMVVSNQPAGKMEAFFKVTNEWKSSPTKIEMENVFAEHEMKVVGPPLKFE